MMLENAVLRRCEDDELLLEKNGEKATTTEADSRSVPSEPVCGDAQPVSSLSPRPPAYDECSLSKGSCMTLFHSFFHLL
jgi:hypothetical protein